MKETSNKAGVLAKCFLVSAISLIVMFALIELYFRIFNPQPIRPAFYKYDPVYGIKMISNIKGYVKEAECNYKFSLNSKGFRDDERPVLKASNNIYRIIVLGDSFAWGCGVEQDEVFVKLLEKMLNSDKPDARYEVFNMGINSWGTAQELLCLKNEALAYKPDLVILEYFKGNDLTDNLYSSLFKLDSIGNLMPAEYRKQNLIWIKRITEDMPFYYFFTQHSYFVNYIRIRLLQKVKDGDVKNINAVLPADFTSYGLKLTKAILEEFFLEVQKNKSKALLLVIPDKNKRADNSLQDAMLIDVCRRNNVPLLEVSGIFAREDSALVYYDVDFHLRPYGHELIAKSVYNFMRYFKTDRDR